MKNVTLTRGEGLLEKGRKLVVDGEVWEDSKGFKSVHDEKPSASLRGISLSKVAELTLRELSRHFSRITLELPNPVASFYGWYGWEFDEINVSLDRVDDQGHVPLKCEVYYDSDHWSNPYTIADFGLALQDVLANHPEFLLKHFTASTGWDGVEGSARYEDTIEHVLLLEKELLALSRLVEDHLDEKQTRELYASMGQEPPSPKSVYVQFRFPTPIKSACEQYVLYFGQFLSDLGIETQTELAEKAARVLFSVTPIEATQALGQIRDALETYLRLPFLPEFIATADQFNDPAVGQLRANVLHLQSQIALAGSILQLKDATIRAKDAEIEFLNGSIDLRGYLARPKSHEESTSEPLIAGIVSVKKYTLKFLEFDFPAVLRKLKRGFK
jgi:hypothetical protein